MTLEMLGSRRGKSSRMIRKANHMSGIGFRISVHHAKDRRSNTHPGCGQICTAHLD